MARMPGEQHSRFFPSRAARATIITPGADVYYRQADPHVVLFGPRASGVPVGNLPDGIRVDFNRQRHAETCTPTGPIYLSPASRGPRYPSNYFSARVRLRE